MSKKSRTGILDQPLSVGLLSAGALAISPGSFLEVQAKLEEAHLTEGADLQGPVTHRPLFMVRHVAFNVPSTCRPLAL